MHNFLSKLGYHKRQVEWLPIFIMRIGIGTFFILSSFFKLFDAEQHQKLLKTLISEKIPFPEFNSYFFPIIGLISGILILIGLLTTLASLVMFIVMIIAIITDRIANVAAYGGILLIENFFYLPEVLYALILFWLFFSGPGKVSFDYHIGKKKRMSSY